MRRPPETAEPAVGREPVRVGRICGVYGIRGWVKVYSYCDPREAILGYQPWLLARADGRWEPIQVVEGRRHGPTVVARLEGVADRDAAEAFMGREIAVPRGALPSPGPGEYYWSELIGLEVHNTSGVALGRVTGLLETGAHDVLVVRGADRERLIPFVEPVYVKSVDLDGGTIVVDWEPDY